MLTEPEDAIRHLQHEKNVWRGIAIGLGATLVLLIMLAVGLSFLTFQEGKVQAIRAEEARMQALAERDLAEAARQAAQKAAKK
jgi:hypothetical protein